MKYRKKKLTPKQYLINRQSAKDTLSTDIWMYENGIYLKNLAVGSAEVFQAVKLANQTLRQYKHFVGVEQADLLRSFLYRAQCPKKRIKITLGQSYRVMNLTKKIKRLAGKLGK